MVSHGAGLQNRYRRPNRSRRGVSVQLRSREHFQEKFAVLAHRAWQLECARDTHPDEAVDGARNVLRILMLFALVTPRWSLIQELRVPVAALVFNDDAGGTGRTALLQLAGGISPSVDEFGLEVWTQHLGDFHRR